jgi:hypothetical protein
MSGKHGAPRMQPQIDIHDDARLHRDQCMNVPRKSRTACMTYPKYQAAISLTTHLSQATPDPKTLPGEPPGPDKPPLEPPGPDKPPLEPPGPDKLPVIPPGPDKPPVIPPGPDKPPVEPPDPGKPPVKPPGPDNPPKMQRSEYNQTDRHTDRSGAAPGDQRRRQCGETTEPWQKKLNVNS